MGRAEAGKTGGAVVAQSVPGAYRVCAPAKCVWVESTRYCPPSTGCGVQVVMRPYNGPAGACSPSVGCTTINGSNYQLTSPYVYDNGEVGRVTRCALSLGLNAASYWTRGFSKLALAGTALSTWGCSAI